MHWLAQKYRMCCKQQALLIQHTATTPGGGSDVVCGWGDFAPKLRKYLFMLFTSPPCTAHPTLISASNPRGSSSFLVFSCRQPGAVILWLANLLEDLGRVLLLVLWVAVAVLWLLRRWSPHCCFCWPAGAWVQGLGSGVDVCVRAGCKGLGSSCTGLCSRVCQGFDWHVLKMAARIAWP